MNIQLKNLPLKNLKEAIVSSGELKFRAGQIVKWLYQKRVTSFAAMNNISKGTREILSQNFSIDTMKAVYILESKDGDAVKFGFQLFDSPHVAESVLLYDGKRRTACISSQLGCALGCVFCKTGSMGFIRNLTQAEIIGQLIGINDYLAKKDDSLVTNIVFMGMGEALLNFENFLTSLEIIMSEDAFKIGARRITVSTAGLVPAIEQLIEQKLTIGLAISLNAYSNEYRNTVMPVNMKYPIEDLVRVAKKYLRHTGRRVTFEYIIIDGVTNTKQAADSLEHLLGGFECKINLIPINPSAENEISRIPSEKMLYEFSDELNKRGLSATVRKSRGRDISGACGQLSGSAATI